MEVLTVLVKVKALLAKGADISAEIFGGKTPLHCACSRVYHPKASQI